MNDTYTPPSFEGKKFNCPHVECGVFAQQLWPLLNSHVILRGDGKSAAKKTINVTPIRLSECTYCNKLAIWVDGKIVHPPTLAAPPPNPDMPDDVKEDYMEARNIVSKSPRASAALLRLAVEKYLPHLGEKNAKSINVGIANLVKKGLPKKAQKALDALRVIGNNAVHPGQIDLKDDQKTALALFELLNIITTEMVTDPKKVDAAFQMIPEHLREAIEKRDAKKP